jgi:hypothetical protein
MDLIVLAAICFLACVFLLFVLFQWTRDSKRKTTTRTAAGGAAGKTEEKKHLRIVSPRRNIEKQDRYSERSHGVQSMRGRSRGCGPGCNECERVVYERLVNSMKPGKRS